MREESSSRWRRRGSSVVFDRDTLAPLIDGEAVMVSLRQALQWQQSFPSDPPEKETILVTGLSAVLDVSPPDEAEHFLASCVCPLIQKIQSYWDRCGLVFGVGVSEKNFQVTATDEQIRYKSHGNEDIQFSRALWDGSDTLDVVRLVRTDTDNGKNVTVGFHVPRIS